MKLLFAIKRMEDASGGAERVLANVTDGLVKLGHEVTILTFDRSPGVSFYPLNSRIELAHLPIGDPALKSGPFVTCRRILALRKKVLKLKPDIAIGFMHSMFVPLSFALIKTGIPVIASEHTVPAHYKNRKLEFLLFRISSKLVSSITIISEKFRSLYPESIKRKMTVMPNPVQLPGAIRAEPGGENTDTRTILTIGRLTEEKNQAVLIEAFALLAHKYPDWKVRIIGHGDLRLELEKKVVELGLQSKVLLPGVTQSIDHEYASAHIFATSSFYESFGLATAEAMFCGLPVIGFADCPGTNELISDGENGILVEERSTGSFADGLERLIQNPEMRQRLGGKGRERLDEFSSEKTALRWQKFLEEIYRQKN